jgi:hypothetical protein
VPAADLKERHWQCLHCLEERAGTLLSAQILGHPRPPNWHPSGLLLESLPKLPACEVLSWEIGAPESGVGSLIQHSQDSGKPVAMGIVMEENSKGSGLQRCQERRLRKDQRPVQPGFRACG